MSTALAPIAAYTKIVIHHPPSSHQSPSSHHPGKKYIQPKRSHATIATYVNCKLDPWDRSGRKLSGSLPRRYNVAGSSAGDLPARC
eukprot:scaffold10768_cov125-Cylindrotheca_fusiformis.AAC.1